MIDEKAYEAANDAAINQVLVYYHSSSFFNILCAL